jgi:hypothetical protein
MIESTHDGIVANGVSRDKEGKSNFGVFTSLSFLGNWFFKLSLLSLGSNVPISLWNGIFGKVVAQIRKN